MSSLSTSKLVDGYLQGHDWRIQENSNAPSSIGAFGKYITSKVVKDYWLSEVYDKVDPRISEAYHDGHIHIHDLGVLSLYCCGYSLQEILKKGVRGVPNIPVSSPAKHLDSALSHITNLTSIFQNEIAGAVAFSSLDTLMAPFIRVDHLTYEEVYQKVQNFIYAINSNSRAGAEPAFSNVTLDIKVPKDLKDKEVEIAGVPQGFKYGDLQEEVDLFNNVLLDIYMAGDSTGKPFSYPIPTYSITKDFDWESDISKKLFALAGKFGTPYFSNYVNSDMDPSDMRAMCPLPGDTLIDIKRSEDSDVETVRLSDISGDVVFIRYRDSWKRAKGIKVNPQIIVRVSTDHSDQLFGEDHLQPIVRNDTIITVHAGEILIDDYLPYEDDDSVLLYKVKDIRRESLSNDLYCMEVI